MSQERILVIRHGALGDLFLCMKPFQDIRAAYPSAHIVLLVAPEFAGFARRMPWFNAVMEDSRPGLLAFWKWIGLGLCLSREKFSAVFDLQNKTRTALYRRFFFARDVKWSRALLQEKKIHRQQEYLNQLRAAEVKDSGLLNLDWLAGDVSAFKLPSRYAVLVPGCSPHLLHKRWPPAYYAALANALKSKGYEVALAGTAADASAIEAIMRGAPFARDLSGKTNLPQLASVLRGAALVVGNDTGPVFLSAMLGAPTLTLMSHHTDPVLSGPVGPRCAYVKRDNLAELAVQEVLEAALRLT